MAILAKHFSDDGERLVSVAKKVRRYWTNMTMLSRTNLFFGISPVIDFTYFTKKWVKFDPLVNFLKKIDRPLGNIFPKSNFFKLYLYVAQRRRRDPSCAAGENFAKIFNFSENFFSEIFRENVYLVFRKYSIKAFSGKNFRPQTIFYTENEVLEIWHSLYNNYIFEL